MQATAWGYYVMAAVHSPLPEAFRAPRLLRWLNVLAVGLSLAAVTGLVLGTFMRAEVALASSARRRLRIQEDIGPEYAPPVVGATSIR